MEEANAIITSFIADHKPSDESLALSLQDLDAGSFSANFVVGPLTNEPLISFQIFFEQSWVPLVRLIRSFYPSLERSRPSDRPISGCRSILRHHCKIPATNASCDDFGTYSH